MISHAAERNCAYARVILLHGDEILWRQFEIEDIEVFGNARRIGRLWQRHNTDLYQITQADLRSGATIFLGQLLCMIIVQEWRPVTCRLWTRQRAVGANDQIVLLGMGTQLLLLESRMTLDLVDDGLDATIGENAFRLAGIEIGQSDAAYKSLIHKFLHFPPRNQIIDIGQLQSAVHIAVVVELLANGQMHQIQINVLQAQVVETQFKGALHNLGIVVNATQFGGHKDILTLDDALLDLLAYRLAHLLLVLIDECSVYVSIAHVDGSTCGLICFRLERLPGAQAQHGHFLAIIQFHCRR